MTMAMTIMAVLKNTMEVMLIMTAAAATHNNSISTKINFGAPTFSGA